MYAITNSDIHQSLEGIAADEVLADGILHYALDMARRDGRACVDMQEVYGLLARVIDSRHYPYLLGMIENAPTVVAARKVAQALSRVMGGDTGGGPTLRTSRAQA